MIALTVILLRAGLIALIFVFGWSLLFGRVKPRTSSKRPSGSKQEPRFDAAGKNISDGDFKEL